MPDPTQEGFVFGMVLGSQKRKKKELEKPFVHLPIPRDFLNQPTNHHLLPIFEHPKLAPEE
jgi:hypothetical protein